MNLTIRLAPAAAAGLLAAGCGTASGPPSASRPAEVGTAAARHHRGDARAGFGGGPERCRGGGAGAEIADGSEGGARLGGQSAGDLDETAGRVLLTCARVAP
jgi:hypothetical protein